MDDRPLNFAVIGCGMLARQQHIPNLAKSPKTVLHTCCDLSDDALAECRDVHGARHISKDFEQVIANPEVDAICLDDAVMATRVAFAAIRSARERRVVKLDEI